MTAFPPVEEDKMHIFKMKICSLGEPKFNFKKQKEAKAQKWVPRSESRRTSS
jgi:hypothetical protein